MQRKNYVCLLVAVVAVATVAIATTDTSNNNPTHHLPEQQIETVVLSPEKPDVLQGLPLTTYTHPAGYEITHPTGWSAYSSPAPAGSTDVASRYFIKPPSQPSRFPPVISVRILPQNDSDFAPDPTVSEKWVETPNERGIIFRGQSDILYFRGPDEEVVYEVKMGSRAASPKLEKAMQWVISTFRVTD